MHRNCVFFLILFSIVGGYVIHPENIRPIQRHLAVLRDSPQKTYPMMSLLNYLNLKRNGMEKIYFDLKPAPKDTVEERKIFEPSRG